MRPKPAPKLKCFPALKRVAIEQQAGGQLNAPTMGVQLNAPARRECVRNPR